MSVHRVAVVGGGIGGLTAALALQDAGFEVSVHEQAGQLTEAGAGLQVAPNAGKVLHHLGLGSALEASGAEAGVTAMRHGRTGRVVREVDHTALRKRHGIPQYRPHRADLQAMLAEALANRNPTALRLGRRLTQVTPRSDGVDLHFEDGKTEQADLLVAADGIRSTVRDAVFPAGGAPRFTGYVAWRGLVPMTELPEALHRAEISFGFGRFLIHYPMRHRTLMNVAAFVRTDVWTDEGWRIPGGVEELREAFADYHDDVREVVAHVPAPTLFRWGIFDRAPLDAWVFGRVALLGDAAHPMLPYMAQGAAMAIEDAMILARALRAADGEAASGLARYEAARRPRANQMAELSAAMGEMFVGDADAYTADSDSTGGRMPGLLDYDPVTAPV